MKNTYGFPLIGEHIDINFDSIYCCICIKYPGTAIQTITDIDLRVRTRFGEIGECCIPALPGPAWVLLNYGMHTILYQEP